ncbi:MAG: hypothetical protein KKB31_05090, partial [Nanoarchaeota archaeon]|nr:hypothetical protein [Nanoarchaeota archaeon]
DDLCMGTDKLRERYCDTELTYTSVDISCSARYGVLWYCTEGECREGEADADEDEEEEGEEVSETTLILCSDGIDNDLDGLIDCYDTDCYIICGDFDYSCQHISPYPTCGGTCPIGEECIAYYVYDGTPDGGWCECMPSGNTACGDSFPTCGGWCLNGEICVADNFGCYCEFDYIGDCTESDEGNYPLINGDCIDTIGGRYVDYCWQDKFQTTLYEYYCLGGECVPLEYNCADFGLSCVDVWDSGSYCGTGEL